MPKFLGSPLEIPAAASTTQAVRKSYVDAGDAALGSRVTALEVAGPAGSGGSGLTPVHIQSGSQTSYTAAPGEYVYVEANAADVTVTLPDDAATGSVISVKKIDVSAAHRVILSIVHGDGSTPRQLDQPGQAVTYYKTATDGWQAQSAVGGLRWRGTWTSGRTYYWGDAVFYNNRLWVLEQVSDTSAPVLDPWRVLGAVGMIPVSPTGWWNYDAKPGEFVILTDPATTTVTLPSNPPAGSIVSIRKTNAALQNSVQVRSTANPIDSPPYSGTGYRLYGPYTSSTFVFDGIGWHVQSTATASPGGTTVTTFNADSDTFELQPGSVVLVNALNSSFDEVTLSATYASGSYWQPGDTVSVIRTEASTGTEVKLACRIDSFTAELWYLSGGEAVTLVWDGSRWRRVSRTSGMRWRGSWVSAATKPKLAYCYGDIVTASGTTYVWTGAAPGNSDPSQGGGWTLMVAGGSGPAGPAGPTGPQGVKGDKGDPGNYGALTPVKVQSPATTYTANPGEYIQVLPDTGDITVTIPDGAPAGSVITVKKTDAVATYSVIMSITHSEGSTTRRLDQPGATVTYYQTPSDGWQTMSYAGGLRWRGLWTSGRGYSWGDAVYYDSQFWVLEATGQTAAPGGAGNGWRSLSYTSLTTKIVSANYTAAARELVAADASSGALTIALPTAPSYRGVIVAVKKTDSSANVVTVSTVDTVEGDTSIRLLSAGVTVTVQWDGTMWRIISTATPNIGSALGVPSGGTTGQVLTKSSGTSFDVTWASASGGGSGGGNFSPWVSGRTMYSPGYYNTNVTLNTAVCYLYPIRVPNACTISGMYVYNSSSAGSGQGIWLGLYNDSAGAVVTSGGPTTRIASGTVTLNGTSKELGITFNYTFSQATTVWAAMVVQASNLPVYANSTPITNFLMGGPSSYVAATPVGKIIGASTYDYASPPGTDLSSNNTTQWTGNLPLFMFPVV
jgi:hypothetical protein